MRRSTAGSRRRRKQKKEAGSAWQAGSTLGQLPISLFARYPFTNYLQNCQQQQGHAQSETTANKRQANKQRQNGKTKRNKTRRDGKRKAEQGEGEEKGTVAGAATQRNTTQRRWDQLQEN